MAGALQEQVLIKDIKENKVVSIKVRWDLTTEITKEQDILDYYFAVVEKTFRIYHEQVPQAFDEPINVVITDKDLPAHAVSGREINAGGVADAYEISWRIAPKRAVKLATKQGTQAAKHLQAITTEFQHEAAHLLLIRLTGYKQFGKYLILTKEGNDFVHMIYNDFEMHGNAMNLIKTLRMLHKPLLLIFTLGKPWTALNFIDIPQVMQRRTELVQMLKNGTAPSGRHEVHKNWT